VLPEFATEEQINAIKQRANLIVQDFDPKELAIFSTTKQVCALSSKDYAGYAL
jgi:hypothetical protein